MGRDRENFKLILDESNVKAGFTNKFGGVSKGAYESLNLATHVGDEIDFVAQNREILKSNLGVKSLLFMDQIHSNKVEIYRDLEQKLEPCDGVITSLKGVALCVMVADCAPILITSNNAIAAVHAGRAGVCLGILSNTINIMKKEFDAKNFRIFIGPHIQTECYEIGNLDLKEFDRFKKEDKFSIRKALEVEIKNLGIQNYKISNICTHCDKRFYSYRRDAITGRFVGFIYLI
ncbi:MAG: peptidoglycan editing factor PgeF [Campylobacter sp.]|nr:peptidoglycan editing factor PgeF [Campylobacter sp.]